MISCEIEIENWKKWDYFYWFKMRIAIWWSSCFSSCILHDNWNGLQLHTYSHSVLLQVLSVAILIISFNWFNWWWYFITPEGFWEIISLCILVSGRYTRQVYVWNIVFSHKVISSFLCTSSVLYTRKRTVLVSCSWVQHWLRVPESILGSC